jgi:hypothetical protein
MAYVLSDCVDCGRQYVGYDCYDRRRWVCSHCGGGNRTYAGDFSMKDMDELLTERSELLSHVEELKKLAGISQ